MKIVQARLAQSQCDIGAVMKQGVDNVQTPISASSLNIERGQVAEMTKLKGNS